MAALLYAVADRALCWRAARWILYGALSAWIALNVPVARTLGSPLTLAMLRAARGELADSIGHHAGALNLTLIALVLGASALFPAALRRLDRRVALGAAAAAVPVVALGFLLPGPAATRGIERNALSALVLSTLPRVPVVSRLAQSARDWRRSPVDSGAADPGPPAGIASLAGRARGRSVVLVVLESTGAAYLGLHGASPDPMPRLSDLARDAWVVDDAYCTYPESIKSLLATFCSVHPAFDTDAGVYARFRPLALAGVLGETGYATALFHTGRFAYLGMRALVEGRGFEVLEDAGDIGGERESSFGVGESATVGRMLAWIDTLPRKRPFFVAYLPIAGHHPYSSEGESPFPTATEFDLYRGALHDADRALGDLLDGLATRGRLEESLLVLFGDHGEAFGQHAGNYAHSLAVYEENVRVPFVLAAPGLIIGQRRIAGPASTIDAAPTILDLVGIEAPANFEGRSLLRAPARRTALFFTDYSLGLLGLRDGRWKCIHELESGRTALYDLITDPGEREDLAARHRERAAAYTGHLRAWCAAQRGILQGRSP